MRLPLLQRALLAIGMSLLTLSLGASPAQAVSIGPDSYGYTATDEVTYSFVDISPSGTRELIDSDDLTSSASLGFSFNFYGTDYTGLSFSNNGLLSFGGANSDFSNIDLTSTSPSGNFPSIAPLWDDWQTFQISSATDGVFYQTLGSPGSRQFIVQWNQVRGYFNSPSDVTFETILFEGSNDILFQYADVNSGDGRSSGAQSTVGIRDTNGNSNGRVLQWSYDSGVISDQYAIRFTTSAEPPPPVVPEPASLALMTLGFASLGLVRKRFRI
jgi:hypothetical protein